MKNKFENRSLILLRGLPGSGKSTLAAVLQEHGKYPVHSIDHYFTDEQTGEYSFEHTKNHVAYSHCEELTRSSMKERCEKIFVDNAFTLEWEMEPYFKLAAEYTYMIFVITVENRHGGKNIHNISDEQLKKMAAKYRIQLL